MKKSTELTKISIVPRLHSIIGEHQYVKVGDRVRVYNIITKKPSFDGTLIAINPDPPGCVYKYPTDHHSGATGLIVTDAGHRHNNALGSTMVID